MCRSCTCTDSPSQFCGAQDTPTSSKWVQSVTPSSLWEQPRRVVSLLPQRRSSNQIGAVSDTWEMLSEQLKAYILSTITLGQQRATKFNAYIICYSSIQQKHNTPLNYDCSSTVPLFLPGADPGVILRGWSPPWPFWKNYLCIASLRLQQFCHQPCYLCICM